MQKSLTLYFTGTESGSSSDSYNWSVVDRNTGNQVVNSSSPNGWSFTPSYAGESSLAITLTHPDNFSAGDYRLTVRYPVSAPCCGCGCGCCCSGGCSSYTNKVGESEFTISSIPSNNGSNCSILIVSNAVITSNLDSGWESNYSQNGSFGGKPLFQNSSGQKIKWGSIFNGSTFNAWYLERASSTGPVVWIASEASSPPLGLWSNSNNNDHVTVSCGDSIDCTFNEGAGLNYSSLSNPSPYFNISFPQNGWDLIVTHKIDGVLQNPVHVYDAGGGNWGWGQPDSSYSGISKTSGTHLFTVTFSKTGCGNVVRTLTLTIGSSSNCVFTDTLIQLSIVGNNIVGKIDKSQNSGWSLDVIHVDPNQNSYFPVVSDDSNGFFTWSVSSSPNGIHNFAATWSKSGCGSHSATNAQITVTSSISNPSISSFVAGVKKRVWSEWNFFR